MKVADVTVEQLRDYNDKLSAIRSEAGNYFKKLACAQDLLKLGEEEQKSAIYHAAVDAVNSFTDAAGSAACDFFDAHVTGAQPSSIAPQPWFIKRRLYENIEKYAKTHKLGDDEFMRLLAEEVGGEVVQHANRTTIHNAVKNNLHYARVPFGNSCAFCLMLASRGFVYKTETTAGEDKGHYHAHCRCKIVAGKKDTKIGDHNPEKLNQRMMQIAKELDITNFNWEDYISDKAMQDLLQQEVRLRDKDWLLHDKPLEVDYENKLAKKNARPHEIEQAERLAQHGIKCIFQVDYEVDEKTKGTAKQKIIGKTDLVNGIELKSLTNAENLRARIGKSLKNARKKKGFKQCHFDAYETDFSNEEIAFALKKEMELRGVKKASFIGKDNTYHTFEI